jgi:hypothetical protein
MNEFEKCDCNAMERLLCVEGVRFLILVTKFNSSIGLVLCSVNAHVLLRLHAYR